MGQRKVQRFIRETLDNFFKEREFDRNVTRVMNKGKSPRIKEFEGDAYDITRISQGGSQVDIFTSAPYEVSGMMIIVNFYHDDGHKLVTGYASLPGNGIFQPNVLGYSYGGQIGDAQLEFEYNAGSIRAYIENIQSTNPPFVFNATWKATIFYK